jgi:hypothetical protein
MSDDFVFSTLIANHPDPATASRALAMAEAAVLRRAADALNALPQDYECDPGRGDAAELLRVMAGATEEKCSPAGAGATPGISSRETRLAQLLDTIRTHRGAWPARRVVDLRRFTGGPTKHTTARGDLAELARRGHLREHGPDHDRFYTLKTRKDGRS